MKKLYGFHLMEVLITLVIISLITAISIPVYSQYLVKARRIEAATMLSKLALAMEQFHLENNTFENASLARLHFPESIAKNHYQLVIQHASYHDYVIAAIPLGKQADQDVSCGTLRLNALEKREISGTGKVEDCW